MRGDVNIRRESILAIINRLTSISGRLLVRKGDHFFQIFDEKRYKRGGAIWLKAGHYLENALHVVAEQNVSN